jgi:CHAT domain-containing protein
MIGEKSFVYQELIKLLLELHRKSPNKGYDREAFVISEKSKSRIFQELMAKAGAKIALSGDETFKRMIIKEQQLIGEITSLQSLLTKELSKAEKQRNEEVMKSLKEQLPRAEKTLTDLEKEIESKYPRYADLKRPKPLSVDDLQRILKLEETVLAYSVGENVSVVFVIGKTKFKLYEIAIKRNELVDLVRRLRTGVEDISDYSDLAKFDPIVSYTLYQKLLAPLASDLQGIKKLYLTADDVLYTLPFEVLVDRPIDQGTFEGAAKKAKAGTDLFLGEYSTLHYLVDTYTISYLPSASVLRSLRMYQKLGYGQWQPPLIAYADPIFSEEEEEEGAQGIKGKGIVKKGLNQDTILTKEIVLRSTGGGGGLARLTDGADEARIIAREVRGKEKDIYLREKATEENVRAADLRKARYVLFSTHGLLGGDFSGVAEPALVLTLVGNPPGIDGFLTMSEVLGLDMNAEMVILSACNTSGRGDKAGRGEGFAGLTRSFMYAGTKSILVTHWSVDSEAAKDLMVEMFRNMKRQPRPEALREAKLKMKASVRDIDGIKVSLSHPFFWAPFVLVGEGQF